MKVVAIYNMKGGVGKTTAAVNLSYLAAAAGRRVLVWDSIHRRPRALPFGSGPASTDSATTSRAPKRSSGPSGKPTTPTCICCRPLAYRKLDRLLDEAGKPKRAVRTLIDTLGHDYDLVLLHAPPASRSSRRASSRPLTPCSCRPFPPCSRSAPWPA